MADIGEGKATCVTGHRVYVYDRGGRHRIAEIDNITKVEWSRGRDRMTEGMVRLEGAACEGQRDLIRTLRTKRHELKIYREGSDRPVWEGPLWRISDEGDAVELYAKDVFAYALATMVTQRYDNSASPTEATTRLANMMTTEMTAWGWESITPPANVVPFVQAHHSTGEARTGAVTEAFSMTVGQHWQALARTGGVDFAAVGRAIHVWDVSAPLGRTRTLTEDDFIGKITVTEYGADLALDAYVLGQEGVYGQAHVSDAKLRDYYGPWAMVFTNYSEEGSVAPTAVELNSQASRNLTGRAPAPVEVRVPDGSTVVLSDDLTIDMLTPGVHIPLRATLNSRDYEQLQKLDLMTVTETSDREDVKVTLSPATKPDTET